MKIELFKIIKEGDEENFELLDEFHLDDLKE
jgi:hypothetical protein